MSSLYVLLHALWKLVLTHITYIFVWSSQITVPLECQKSWWGQVYLVGTICPPPKKKWNNANEYTTSWFGWLSSPLVPIHSGSPSLKLLSGAIFSFLLLCNGTKPFLGRILNLISQNIISLTFFPCRHIKVVVMRCLIDLFFFVVTQWGKKPFDVPFQLFNSNLMNKLIVRIFGSMGNIVHFNHYKIILKSKCHRHHIK